MSSYYAESIKSAARDAVFLAYGLEKDAFSFRDTLRGLSDKAKSFGGLFARTTQPSIGTAPTLRAPGLPPLRDFLEAARHHPTVSSTPMQMAHVPGASSPQARTLSLAPEPAVRPSVSSHPTLPATPSEMAHVPGAVGRDARTLNLASGTFRQGGDSVIATPRVPRASERALGGESISGKRYTGMGLGGMLSISPEGAFLHRDPKFRQMYRNAVQGGQGMEELDALAHHLMRHQASGGQVNAMRARQIMQTPAYARTLQEMKTGSLLNPYKSGRSQ